MQCTDLRGGLTHQHEALGVRDDFGGVESLLEVIDELLLIALESLLLGARDNLACTGTLTLDGRKAASENRLTDEGDCRMLLKMKTLPGEPIC